MKARALAIGTLMAALALSGCATSADTATSPSPSAAPSTAPSPTPQPTVPEPTTQPTPEPTAEPTTPNHAVNIPTSCDALGTPEAREADLQGLQPQPVGVNDGPVRDIPAGGTVVLHCMWFAGDVTGGNVQIATVDEAAAQQLFEQFHDSGATCEAVGVYSRCRLDTTGTYYDQTYPVTSWILYEGTTWVSVYASNGEFANLQQAIGTQIWG